MENSDDQTRIISSRNRSPVSKFGTVTLNYVLGDEIVSRVFSNTFVIGRSLDCDVVVNDDGVSRKHVEIMLTDAGWEIKDLNSSNGTYVNGLRIDQQVLTDQAEIHLGGDQTAFTVSVEQAIAQLPNRPQALNTIANVNNDQPVVTAPRQEETEKELLDRYFKDKPEHEMGEHTLMMRKIIRQEKEKETKKVSSRYKGVVASVAVLLVLSVAFIAYQQVQLSKAQSIAVDMFYDIKNIEIQVVQTEIELKKNASAKQVSDIALKRQKLKAMKARYQDYLSELDFAKKFKPSLSEEDQAIVNMAQIFGECDIELPAEFISEVKKYIAKWQSSNRLAEAVSRIDKLGHTRMVVNAMNSADLPAQFLYISLQESNFRFDAIGPETRFGIAKGAWQFIPSTGEEYGLKIGPLAAYREHDPDDDRFDFEKASIAAAKYLKKVYSREAQASGLLVIASYNWGHNRVRRLINEMPDNPRDRNFWKFSQKYKMPQETYDYVFYIFSAAVIGENPALFGFDFRNPVLVGLESNQPGVL